MKIGSMRWSPQTAVVCWALVLAGTFAIGFAPVGWPFQDLYKEMYRAYAYSWPEAVAGAFGRGVEYRPLFVLAVKALYETVGLSLWFYKALVVAQFALSLYFLTRIMAPASWPSAVAAIASLCCVAGLHTSRVLSAFFPVNHHSLILTAVLCAAAIGVQHWRRWHDWALFPLTLGALLTIEFGLVIPPLILALWLARAPGVSTRGLFATFGGLALYVTLRLALSPDGSPPDVYTDTGIGFSSVSKERLADIFFHAPVLLWAYNVSVAFLTVLFSEPRNGMFVFVQSLLEGRTPAWLWWHVGTSTLSTVVVFVGLAGWRQTEGRERHVLVVGVVLLMSSLLGFLYARDRIGLVAGAGYSLLLYAGLVRLWHQGLAHHHQRLAAAAVAIVLCGWLVRDGEMVALLRDKAWQSSNEWRGRYEDLGGLIPPQTDLLDQLRKQGLAAEAPDPHEDPAWTYLLFQRDQGRRVAPR